MAIVLKVSTTTDKAATDVPHVLASIALTITIKDRKAISLAKVISPAKAATSHVPATIVKAAINKEKVISRGKVVISLAQDIIAKEFINRERDISREKEAIVLVTTVMEKEVINPSKVASSVVRVLPGTILMLSTA